MVRDAYSHIFINASSSCLFGLIGVPICSVDERGDGGVSVKSALFF